MQKQLALDPENFLGTVQKHPGWLGRSSGPVVTLGGSSHRLAIERAVLSPGKFADPHSPPPSPPLTAIVSDAFRFRYSVLHVRNLEGKNQAGSSVAKSPPGAQERLRAREEAYLSLSGQSRSSFPQECKVGLGNSRDAGVGPVGSIGPAPASTKRPGAQLRRAEDSLKASCSVLGSAS